MAELYQNDRQILFDVHPLQLKQKPGENILLSSKGVYDIKGNPNIDGAYELTNIRIIWQSLSDPCIYGVEYDVSCKKQPQIQFQEDVKIVDIQYNHQSAYKINQMNQDCEIVVSTELGLAMEKLPDDVKLSDLWKIII